MLLCVLTGKSTLESAAYTACLRGGTDVVIRIQHVHNTSASLFS